MSTYNDCFFACALKPDTPQSVIDVLSYMTRETDYEFTDPPDAHFFRNEPDWRDFLRELFDFRVAPGLLVSRLERKTQEYLNRPPVDFYEISFRRTVHDDVEYPMWFEFLHWIAPYSDTEGFVGYYRADYELNPTLVYFKDGDVFDYDVKVPPEELYRHRW